ncbi:copper resistance CopC family protein [Thermoactinospora rubra]|uniref:copper resistance CopC family protein n=1 Tax=Thermoactinospora rubra TaxID=1088767 RepID=UPI001301D1AA|nr:copper resistance protein CopC [Thermoactinospora rubra]
MALPTALSPRFVRSLAAVVLGCGALMFTAASPALAHDRLKSSSPAKGAEVAEVERIELEYTSRVRFPTVVLHDRDGRQVALGKPVVAGHKVVADVTERLAPGAYVIAWRVVSSDGHPIEGETPFTVAGRATPASSAQPSPASSAASPPASPAASPAASRQAGEDLAAASQGRPGLPGWLWAVAAVLVIAGVGLWLRARRGDGPDTA